MGYRQSSYDPLAYEQPGRPLRPFNWVQWAGVCLIAAACLLMLARVAADLFGLAVPVTIPSSILVGLPMMGSLLVNSRREPGGEVTGEVLASRRKLVLLFSLGGAVLIVLSLLLLKGA